ncbi:bud emergence protein 1 [Actinomortierella ambigua]|nr:bud emergence protein 1 [Actinomortierella ambigua]
MQSLRRSLQNKNSNGGLGRTAAGLAPPRKVIKALYDYSSSQPEELSFQKGDFYHVIGNEDDEDWYEACNPITGARGFVPVAYFQVLEKSQRNSGGNSGEENNGPLDNQPQQQQQYQHHQEPHGSNGGGHYHQQQQQQQQQHSYQQQQQQQHYQQQQQPFGSPASSKVSTPGAGAAASPATPSGTLPKCAPLYGIVLFDFAAERPDELDAKVGDAILVIAQSNEEWYVAKPIGRLGGPGLIPASFIEIRDMASNKPIDVQEHLRKTGTAIPRVDEWKKQALEYKNNSIPLGRLDPNDALHQHQQRQQHPHPQQQQPQQQQQLSPPPQQPQQYQDPSGQYSQPHIPMNQYPGNQPMHPQQFQQLHQQQQSQGPTLQQLKNKMSRDLKSSAPARDPALRRLPSQEDIHRRTPIREEPPGSRTPNASYSASGRMEDNMQDSGYGHDQHQHQHPTHPNQLVQASVESFHHEEDQYWYSVRVELASGAVRHLYRLYEDFYNFHIALLEEFPVESGRVGDQSRRILPYMPIPLNVVTDSVSAARRTDLDNYVKSLVTMPQRICSHPLVETFFSVKEGDTETPPGAGSSSSSRDRDTVSSTASVSSPAMGRERAASSASRASPSGGPRAVFQSRSQGPGSFRSYTDDPPSANGSPSMRSQSTFASTTPGGSERAGSEENIKLKISFQDDIMAMRIPVSVSFRTLQQKVFERLRVDHRELSCRDAAGEFTPIRSDADWREAADRSGGKLMIYVD